MKTTDVVAGLEYVTDTSGYRARVTVTEPPANARVQVAVSAGSLWTGEEWIEAGESGSVVCRHIVSSWEQWAEANTDVLPLRRRSEVEAAEEQAGDRALLVDPDRYLPRAYESHRLQWDMGPDDFTPLLTAGGAATVWRTVLPDTRARETAVAPLLMGLRGPVARDLVAAFIASRPWLADQDEASTRLRGLPDPEHVGYAWARRETAGDGPARVGTVFARAAAQLDIAYDDARGSLDRHRYPGIDVLTDDDVAFFQTAVSDEQRAQVDVLCGSMPAHLVDAESRAVVEGLGWMPVVAGVTSGRKVHRPGCRSLRESRATLADGTLRPLWYYGAHQWADYCGTCDGPILGRPTLVSHFLAASDVWTANGRGQLEPWQRTVVARLVAAAVESALDPDPAVKLTRRLLERFGAIDQGERGWNLYQSLTLYQSATDLADDEYVSLRSEAESILDEARSIAGTTASGSPNHDLGVLEDRGVPHAARILFTLPGASR